MSDAPQDEVHAVAEAMVQSIWGNGAVVSLQALRDARAFIAAADALLKLRLAQQVNTKLPVAIETQCLGERIRWPADGTSEPALRHDTEGGLDHNEDDGA